MQLCTQFRTATLSRPTLGCASVSGRRPPRLLRALTSRPWRISSRSVSVTTFGTVVASSSPDLSDARARWKDGLERGGNKLSAMLAKQIARTPRAMRYNMTDELLSQSTQGCRTKGRGAFLERVAAIGRRAAAYRSACRPPLRQDYRRAVLKVRHRPSRHPAPSGDDAGRNNPCPTLLPRTPMLRSLRRKTRQFDGEAARCTGKAQPAARGVPTCRTLKWFAAGFGGTLLDRYACAFDHVRPFHDLGFDEWVDVGERRIHGHPGIPDYSVLHRGISECFSHLRI